ncbi:MAG: hypothetical protein ACK5LG_21785 [Bacteroides thetaiotaomicron]
MELEHRYSKNQLVSRIRKEFEECDSFNFAEHFASMDLDPDLCISILVQLCIHKRANMQTMVGCVRRRADNVQEVAGTLEALAKADFINWDPELEMFIVAMDISKDVRDEIDLYQYPLPMIIEPKEVKDNMDTGYLTSRYSVILKNNHHDEDVCLDHINSCNRTALSIDVDVVNMISNKWKGLDKQKPDETRDDFLRRVKAFRKYDETAHTVMSLLVKHGNRLHLPHGFDKRGRTFARGHHVNYQGNAWNKAVICFAEGEVVECN